MLEELADESENQGLKMNKSKTKVMMENNTPVRIISTAPRSRTLKVTSVWDRDTASESKNQDKEIQRRITAGWTAFPLLEETSLHLMRTSSNDIRRGNMGTHHQAKNKLPAAQTNMDRG